MSDQGDLKTFNVTYELHGRSVGKMRNEVTGRQVEPSVEPEFNMASDEAGFHGGDGSAPLPLAYFCTGLVTCLMTQIRAFSKRLRIDLAVLNALDECAGVALPPLLRACDLVAIDTSVRRLHRGER